MLHEVVDMNRKQPKCFVLHEVVDMNRKQPKCFVLHEVVDTRSCGYTKVSTRDRVFEAGTGAS